MTEIVECTGLYHIYKTGTLEVVALQGLDLTVAEAEMVAVVGRSGSGKTTLMNILAALETPSAGQARVAGIDIVALSPRARLDYHRRVVGYVWQNARASLVAELTAEENIQLPLLGSRLARGERLSRTDGLLAMLRMGDRAHLRPASLSAGEQQRLAVAVALANLPRLLLADEPTAELDRASAGRLLDDLARLREELGITVLLVTHDPLVERNVDRVVRIRDGRTSTETRWSGTADEAVADELVIMDRAGRIQIPGVHLEALRLKDRVRIRRQGDRLVISRHDDEDEPGD